MILVLNVTGLGKFKTKNSPKINIWKIEEETFHRM